MRKTRLLIILLSTIYSNSIHILNEINNDLDWEIIKYHNDGVLVSESYNENINAKYIRVEKEVKFDPDLVFDVITDIDVYSSIITNKNISSRLIDVKNDTIYAYQLITNVIPFIRDRQYIFKMFFSSKNQLDWYILEEQNFRLKPYINNKTNTLILGAGSWSIENKDDKNILVKTIYVDDEVNLPMIFVQKLKRDQVVQIFKDVINAVTKQEK